MKILIAGDFCPQNRVAEFFQQRQFEKVLGDARNVIRQADWSVVNFECSVVEGGDHPIPKVGPNLKCNETGVEAVKWAGFDGVTLANNHFGDYGDKSVKLSLSLFAKHGIDTVGGGASLEDASKTLYKNIKGKTLAVINCCEHEFTIATDNLGGANPLKSDSAILCYQRSESKK